MTDNNNNNNNNNNNSNNITQQDKPKLEIELSVPSSDPDFQGIGVLQSTAFAEKQSPCSSPIESQKAMAKTYQTYKKKYPTKLQHCRIIKDPKTNVVMAGCQLMMHGDPGDLSMPSDMRHSLHGNDHEEVYIEWIACHPDHTGKGLGSKLLRWADQAAIESGAQRLTLQVMKANTGAVRLYERKGFVITKDPTINDECDECIASCCVFFCLGCKYWSLLYMEKQLSLQQQEENNNNTASNQNETQPTTTTTEQQSLTMER